MGEKLWGGRFATPTDPLVEEFTTSLPVERRLARYDVLGSIAHARMLGRCRILPASTARRLVRGLQAILAGLERGRLRLGGGHEDVHSAVQAALARRIGPAAQTLQTARSRNDQIALDMRLYCRDALGGIQRLIQTAQRAMVTFAHQHERVVLPGCTHLQHAQPVLLAHHILAYCEMLERDRGRLSDAWARADELPLGAGALAGTSFPIDRPYVARLLGFSRVSRNSVDTVSDRDFLLEILGALALLAMHTSRICEDLVLWMTAEFGFLELEEGLRTGSSMMPQKRNPDLLELVRGESGRVYGNLMALLTTMKGLPLSYQRDMQADKGPVFDSVDRSGMHLTVLARVFAGLRVHGDRIAAALQDESLYATDLAEYLVRRGMRFHAAHTAVGRLLADSAARRRPLRGFSVAELRRYAPAFGRDALALLDARVSVRGKRSAGGTAPRAVRAALRAWERRLRVR